MCEHVSQLKSQIMTCISTISPVGRLYPHRNQSFLQLDQHLIYQINFHFAINA